MKIVVVVRTYNEQENLPKFIDSYIDWVDLILVQDDWSEDQEYLYDLPRKVLVSHYSGERIERKNITRAKQDVQLNSLIRWAEHLRADWIIMDDCDSVPNIHLQEDGRSILEGCKQDFVYTTRFYLYKDHGYFPEMSNHNGNLVPSILAWKAHKGFNFINNVDNSQKFTLPDSEQIRKLEIPYILLHSPWSSDKIIEEKRMRYTEIYGEQYATFDPLSFGGELELLPEWIK